MYCKNCSGIKFKELIIFTMLIMNQPGKSGQTEHLIKE